MFHFLFDSKVLKKIFKKFASVIFFLLNWMFSIIKKTLLYIKKKYVFYLKKLKSVNLKNVLTKIFSQINRNYNNCFFFWSNGMDPRLMLWNLKSVKGCFGSVTFCLVHVRLVQVRLVQVRLDNILARHSLPRHHFT